MGKGDYASVLKRMRLADGTLFPIPLTLPLTDPEDGEIGCEIAFRRPENELNGCHTRREISEWDAVHEALQVYGTNDLRHPIEAEMQQWGGVYVSAPLRVLNLPTHFNPPESRRPSKQR